MVIPSFFGCTVCFNPWYVDFISGLSSCENQPYFGWLIVELFSLLQVKIGLIRNLLFVAYSILLGCYVFMAKPLAFVILWGSFSWKNIHGEHGWHRILKYNYALHVQMFFILQSLRCISWMSRGFS
jgi:hypothetical protein